jgi:hypothetical protein
MVAAREDSCSSPRIFRVCVIPAERKNQEKRSAALFTSLLIAAAIVSLSCAKGGPGGQPIPTLYANFRPVITRIGGSASAVAVPTDGKLVLAGAFNAI